jgi:prolyl oligopeptidase
VSSILEYPNVWRNESQVEIIHGVAVTDPYRWLEDLDSEETAEFVKAQQSLSSNFLSTLSNRKLIKEHISSLVNYERWGSPRSAAGSFITFMHNTGLQDHDVMKGEGESGIQTLLDPSKLSDDGSISLSPYYQKFSINGSLFAYALVIKGSDWLEGKVMKIPSGEVLTDSLINIKWPDFSFSKTGAGLFYSVG